MEHINTFLAHDHIAWLAERMARISYVELTASLGTTHAQHTEGGKHFFCNFAFV